MSKHRHDVNKQMQMSTPRTKWKLWFIYFAFQAPQKTTAKQFEIQVLTLRESQTSSNYSGNTLATATPLVLYNAISCKMQIVQKTTSQGRHEIQQPPIPDPHSSNQLMPQILVPIFVQSAIFHDLFQVRQCPQRGTSANWRITYFSQARIPFLSSNQQREE